jgi:hypothetical protein
MDRTTSSASVVRGSRFAWREDYAALPRTGSGLVYPRLRPPSPSPWILMVCRSPETMLAYEVIEKVVAMHAGKPKHDAGVVARHRV